MQVMSTDRRLRRDRTIAKFAIVTYGFVRHFFVCRGASGLLSLAYLKNVTSRHDPATQYGLHDDLRGMHVLLSIAQQFHVTQCFGGMSHCICSVL